MRRRSFASNDRATRKPAAARLIFAAASIAIAWAAFFATVHVAHFRLRWPRRASLAAVASCWLLLAALSIAALGLDDQGLLAASGLLVPATVSAGWIIASR